MILLLFALHYLSGLASSAPTGCVDATTLESVDCSGVKVYSTNFRSTTQIITSCVSTILLCTWFTIHPDVYGYKSTWKQRLGRKLELFVWALLMPEVVMMWACNQWFGAGKIRNALGKGWSRVEGHFLQMGGIVFFRGGRKCYLDLDTVLDTDTNSFVGPVDQGEDTHYLIRRELNNLHKIVTRDEITDRSKCDALSKAIVLVQTTWFTFQCVARAVQGLAVTELEIVTLAYAALNGVMCFFWWKKPLDVQCPVFIELNGMGVWREMPFELGSQGSDSGSSTTPNPESQPLIGEKEAEVSKSTWLRGLKSPLRAIAPIGVLRKVLFISDVLD